MPSTAEILAGLTAISNQWKEVAGVWHLALAIIVVALLAGRRPPRRTAATWAAFPLLSVSVAAFCFGNHFNCLIFAALAAALLTIARGLPADRVTRGPLWSSVLGLLMIAFGWVYPHFLLGIPAYVYLIAAPFGLIPCPTLSLLIGFALLGNAFGSRPWSLTLALAGLFYGLFGTFRLGVHLDLALLVGAAALLILSSPCRLAGQDAPAPELPANY